VAHRFLDKQNDGFAFRLTALSRRSDEDAERVRTNEIRNGSRSLTSRDQRMAGRKEIESQLATGNDLLDFVQYETPPSARAEQSFAAAA
jgi:hypothetical protein